MKKYYIVFLMMLFVPYLHASIAIDPLRIELAALPGEKIEGFYTVTNTKDVPVLVTIQSKNYFTLEENKEIDIDDWITLSLREFRIEAKGSKKIKYTIIVPQEAEGFIMVLNSFMPRTLNDQGEIEEAMLNTAFSIPVYVRIKGSEKISAEIEKLDIAGNAQNLSVMVTVHNTGNTYLRPSGKVDIMRKGKILGSMNLKEGWPVFPGKSESYRGKQGGFNLKPGTYTMIAKLINDEPALHIEKKGYFVVNKKGIVKKK